MKKSSIEKLRKFVKKRAYLQCCDVGWYEYNTKFFAFINRFNAIAKNYMLVIEGEEYTRGTFSSPNNRYHEAHKMTLRVYLRKIEHISKNAKSGGYKKLQPVANGNLGIRVILIDNNQIKNLMLNRGVK